MAYVTWKVTIKSDGHKHSRALAENVEEIERQRGHMRGTVLELDSTRIVFDLIVFTPSDEKDASAREVVNAMIDLVVKPTRDQWDTSKSEPAVKYGGVR